MLRLLAQREQGYDDIAALMGLSVEEVRAKVVGALAQLEAEGQPRPDVPPPFPVAGEEGGPPTPAASEEQPPVPKAETPKEPPPIPPAPEPPLANATPVAEPAAPKATPAAVASAGGGSAGGGRTFTVPSGRGLWPWIGGAVGIIAVVVAVILIAGGGGGGSSSTESAGTTADTSQRTGAEEAETGKGKEAAEKTSNPTASKEPTFAVLNPVGGTSANGKAIFGRVKNKLALQVVATGLQTTGKNDAYTVWLAQTEKKMLPLASSEVTAKSNGKIAAQFEVPTEVLAYLANGTFDQIYVTHTQNAQLAASLKEATQKKEAPAYTGEPVLKGTVTGPIVGAALKEEEEKEAKEKGE
jgi:hypothetical protein